MESGPPASTPSAPPVPIDQMDIIPGYEGFIAGQAPPPPPYDASAPPAPVDASNFSRVNAISAEQAKHFMLEETVNHCCWGKKAARDMTVTAVESRSATHYSLESFCEKRSTEWRTEAFIGQVIDGPMNGRAPSPWEVFVQPPAPFVESKLDMEVPHTASVKRCYHCHGHGKRDCNFCHHGKRECFSCNAQTRSQCNFCHGHGHQRCTMCDGHGHNQCLSCRGTGSLKCYIVMHVHFKTHTSDFVQESAGSALPIDLIKKAGGDTVFQDEAVRVWPVSNYPDAGINQASQRLTTDHATRIASTERILMQRQRIRTVPVNECCFDYRGRIGTFFVYGNENYVHAPDYPQKCCCGCSVL